MIDADPRTRDSIWQGVSLSLAALADPRVLDAASPAEGEEFDPEAFIRERGTLFLLATGAGAGKSAALVAALVEDLVETARRVAARSTGARLDPPLLLCLDEIGNLAPLPSLPTLMAEGGGTGITTLAVLQSLAQARDKWNEHQAGAIWDASIVKIILGGASNSRDLQDLSTLIGERDELTDTTTVGDHGSRSNQRACGGSRSCRPITSDASRSALPSPWLALSPTDHHRPARLARPTRRQAAPVGSSRGRTAPARRPRAVALAGFWGGRVHLPATSGPDEERAA